MKKRKNRVIVYALLYLTAMIGCLTYASKVDANSEVGVVYMKTHQKLFDKIHFPMDTGLVYGGYYLTSPVGDIGLRITVGKSTETIDMYATNDLIYKNQINAMYSGEIIYKYRFDKASILLGVGKTDYKSTWWVNGEKPSWSDGTDSDWSYLGGIRYDLDDNLYLEVLYHDIYRKHKENYGRETTRGFSLGLGYSF